MNNKIIDISVKRAQLKKNIKDNSILYDDMDEVDQDEYELLQGIDIATYPDGTKYVGEWKDGLWYGRGTITRTNGTKYVGEFKEGLPNGQGTHTDPNGDKYVAEFKDGIPNGQGIATYFDGSKYVGEFENGLAHGQGTFTFPDGFSFEGIWEKNDYIRDVRKQSDGTCLPTITKRQEEYFSPSNSAFEWLPYIVGNTILIGLVIYINYDMYISNESTLWEIFSDTFIWLSIGGIIAYILHPKER